MGLSTNNHLASQDEQNTFFRPSDHACGPPHCTTQCCVSTGESTTCTLPPRGTSSTQHPEEVPQEYFIQSLRTLAPNYWDRPETSDCTIVVPVPQVPDGPLYPTFSGPFTPQTRTTTPILCNSSGSGRRVTEPALESLPRIHLQLHVDYLSAHSRYIRALLSGTNPVDLVRTTMNTFNGSRSDHRYSVPENRLPRLLPGPSNHPTLYLPVPDPSSFRLIVHWMYFGNTTFIEESLHKGFVHWEGLARNVEYLGVSSELKIFLKLWYYGEEYGDSGYKIDMTDYDSIVTSGDESDSESENTKELPRGRPRTRHPLPYQKPRTRLLCN